MDKMNIKNKLLSISVFEDNEWLDKYCETAYYKGRWKTAGGYHWEYA